MNEQLLGKLFNEKRYRDAVHVAILPVEAGEDIYPGQTVMVDAEQRAFPRNRGSAVGIVDPFLEGRIFKGQKCYVCLWPGSITSLRHQWVHPVLDQDLTQEEVAALEKIPSRAEAVEYITTLGKQINKTYNEMLDVGDTWCLDQNWTYDNDEHYKIVDDWDHFWACYKVISGGREPLDKACPFTCSC